MSAETYKKYDVVCVMPSNYYLKPSAVPEMREGGQYYTSIQHIEDFALSLVPKDFNGDIKVVSTRMEYMESTIKRGNVFVIVTYGDTIEAFQTNIYTFSPYSIEVEEFDDYKKARRKYYDKRGTRVNIYEKTE